MDTEPLPSLGAHRPRTLAGARDALHLAAQPLAAAAYALLEARPDHSQASLRWEPVRRGFVGGDLGGGLRCFLDATDGRAGLLGADGAELGALSTERLGLDDLFAGKVELLAAAGVRVPAAGLAPPPYELPAELVNAAPGVPASGEREELTRWFELGASLVGTVSVEFLGGAEPHVWPHHFDLAALGVLDTDADAEEARSVGVGFSPGDGAIAEPYFYVTPWPAPEPGALPALARGATWHTEGFTSAVLPGTRVVGRRDARAQCDLVLGALREAAAASLVLLED
jgi:hypothetical protein